MYLRRIDVLPGIVADEADRAPGGPARRTHGVEREGKVHAPGLSHVSLGQLRAAVPAGVAAVSNIPNLLHREHDDVLRRCDEHGVIWAPNFPLDGGGTPDRPQ